MLVLSLAVGGGLIGPASSAWAQGGLIYLPLVMRNYSPGSAGGGLALRFYGHGPGAPQQDRVKIRIDGPPVPADIGNGDFTIEFWMKANLSDNTGSATCNVNNGDGWITANIIVDRDVYGPGDHGDFGVALSNGRIAFGVHNGSSGSTLCGNINVADGAWHHIVVTRAAATGALRIFVDGQLDGQRSGPTGNLSYRDGRSTSWPNSDPFLVLGAEKHDAGPAYPAYNGLFDELRLSTVVRYTGNFTRPSAPFTTDANTAALYHFDEGPAGPCTGTVLDSSGASGGPSHGQCHYGGAGQAGPVYVTDQPFP
jgi:hypothetical protein